MNFIYWILLGLISGFIASKIMYNQGSGFLMDVVLGVVGAVVGGFVFSLLGIGGVDGFNLYSLVVAVIGAVIVIWVYHKIV